MQASLMKTADKLQDYHPSFQNVPDRMSSAVTEPTAKIDFNG